MIRSIKIILIISLVPVAGYIGFYIWEVISLTEQHVILTDDWKLELCIRMDDTFLDGQDDYRFVFSQKERPDKKVELRIDDCRSRCWILNKSKQSPLKILLYGCALNSQRIYLIDLNLNTCVQLKSIPPGYLLIDTLTNLYVDKQLPPNYRY